MRQNIEEEEDETEGRNVAIKTEIKCRGETEETERGEMRGTR